MISFLESFFTTFSIVSLMELGDKTQLILLSLLARYRSGKEVFFGASLAFAALTIMGGVLGHEASIIIPSHLVSQMSALLFIIIGLFTLIQRKNELKEEEGGRSLSPFKASFMGISLAELGDKTQITVFSLSAVSRNPFATILGGYLALIFICFLTLEIGDAILRRIPRRMLRFISGILFIIVGIVLLLS
ncbi:MAG: hypothetical protein DRJ47_00210 [Thermoprotei archaeon]|nr:MAG: hypothetical protein DRJ47_00210 [Thermoprotei archaeon]